MAGGAQWVLSGQQRLGKGDLGRWEGGEECGREEGNESGGLHCSLVV